MLILVTLADGTLPGGIDRERGDLVQRVRDGREIALVS